MKLHIKCSGSGPDLVLIHGWGLHGGIWDGFATLLEPDFRVWRVDLPGHGASGWSGETVLDDMVDRVLAALPVTAAWLGWSLGGLVALRAALRAPARVRALVLLASTPCFVRRPGWQAAMPPGLLETFAGELQADYLNTLNRFLSLQVRGSEAAGDTLRALRRQLLARGKPFPDALRAGLAILRDTDLRAAITGLACPLLVLAGERDTLVPEAAARATAALVPHAGVGVIAGAGHAPFIARPRAVAGLVRRFLQAVPSLEPGDRHARDA